MIGVIIILVAGSLWGFSGTCAQFLFREYDITPLYLTTARMVSSGLILAAIALVRQKNRVKRMFRKRKTMFNLVLFAVMGILFNQLAYLEAIDHTNSGTATILQYIGPVLIMVVSCVMEKRMPTKIEVLAIVLVIIGAWLLATHGDFGSLYITPMGLFWGLLSAIAAVFYTMLPIKLIDKYGSIPVVGFGMLTGGAAMLLINGTNGGPATYDARFYLFMGIIIIFGTVIPYTGYLLGITYCGAVKGSMIASIEPVAATLCMVLWLGEVFYPIDLVGFACILATVFLLARGKED